MDSAPSRRTTMSTTQNLKCATEGILLSLDAANPDSYPGLGDKWYDTSGNGNHFYLLNGPTFDGGKIKNITFDGVNQYGAWIGPSGYSTNASNIENRFIGTNRNLNTSPFNNRTIEIWFKLNNTLSQYAGLFADRVNDTGGVFSFGTLAQYRGKFSWTWDDSVGGAPGTNKTVAVGEWIQLVVLLRDSYYFTYYVNGVLDTPENRSTDLASLSSNAWSIARENRFGYYLACSVSVIRMYNRELTAAEIFQNYNALKIRFGL